MKGRKRHALKITAIICLLSVIVTSCKKSDAYTVLPEETETEEETLRLEEQTEQDTESMFLEFEGDTTAQNLQCLKNADTDSLVGLSFGDEIDYDKYRSSGGLDGAACYYFKDGSYENISFVFSGKGGGFSGLYAISGDFFGIELWEDSLETLTDVLGEAEIIEENQNGADAVWAKWRFEQATLSAKIRDGKICAIKYLANGNTADAKEKAQTDFEADRMVGAPTAQTIYFWAAYAERFDVCASYTHYDEGYDVSKVDDFIQDYLRSQGIHKEKPDGITYNRNGDPFVEYYKNAENGQYCFIVHLRDKYNNDAYQDDVYCITHIMNEDDKAGYMLYEQDTAQHTSRERMYDIWGKRMAEVSYEYVPKMPFPLVTEARNLTANFLPAPLIRNQKMYFYKEEAQLDADGKFLASVVADRWAPDKDYFFYSCRTVYHANGSLKAIEEELVTDDSEEDWGGWDKELDYSGQISFQYDSNGIVKRADYARSQYVHGTGDCAGEILYDEKGRMIYNDYYITHGTDAGIYLYDGDSDMPWCVLRWCSAMPGIETISIFLPKE